ncbi:hypothetical protein AB0C34_01140 [Nocardia sp. NPDC049220]|uniref:hypothetical protein n=1 Tax=Nocardia sp. NPDC049220 TaxID=3155273 RepID=UPI0033C0F8E5
MTTMSAPRIAGVATAGYGLAVALRPGVLLGPCGWSDDNTAGRAVARMAGMRDLASGLAMAVAARPNTMRLAIAIRVGSDLSDAVVLGRALRGRPQRAKAIAATVGWGLLCAATIAATRTG